MMLTAGGHGYSGTPLPRKLGIKPGHLVALVNAPAGFAESLGELPGAELTLSLDAAPAFDVIVFFVTWQAELDAELGALRRRMTPACGLWSAGRNGRPGCPPT